MEESFKKIEHAKVGSQPIAVIGLGCRLPGGIDSPEKFWQLLVEEREAITEVPLDRWQLDRHFDADRTKPLAQYVRRGGFIEGIDQFDPALFGITSREAICLDPQQRLLLEVSWRALEDGGQPLDQLRGESIGVFMGISSSDYISLLWASEQDYLFPDNEPFVLAGNTGCIAANRISYVFDFKGPSFTVDTACSSSLVAVHLACESLRRGECRAALAGGAQVLLQPGVQMSFCKAGLLSPEGRCKSFDAAADGYVRSEGAGVVLLKPLEDALRDGDPVQAVIRGSAVNSDGRSNGLSAPNRRAQIACMRDAYAKAGVDPSSVLYVEAHGTGTRLGDPVELLAIGSVMGVGRPSHFPCRVGSVKSNLGHSETAAGITGLIKAVLCLRQRKIPATLHCRTPNPAVDFQKLGLQVQTSLEVFPDGIQSAVLGVSSFGFGGTNAHVVLQEAVSTIGSHPAVTPLEDEPPIQLLCLSAQSLEALRLLASAYAALIRRQPQMSLNNICATTHLERGCFRYRLVLVAADRQELLSQLEGPSDPICCGEVCEKTYNRPLPKELAQIQLGLRGISGRRQLQALAQAIGAGHNCDWSYFHAPYPHRPCSVPGHPFVRQRYWWNKSGEERKNGRLWRHQLGFVGVERHISGVLRVLDLPGPLRHFEVELSSSEPSDLGQHCVRQVTIFPATGYLQLAIEAEHLRGRGESPFVLSNFNIEKSLSLSSDPVCMQLVSDGEQLTFFAQTESGGAWQQLAKLRVGASPLDSKFIAPGEAIQADIGMNSVMQMSNEELIAIQVNAFYGALSNAGFQYGSPYRPIRNLRAGAGEAWAQLERPVAAPDRCMLDGCLQSVAAALSPNLEPEKLFVPVGIEKIIFKQWPLPNRFSCTCRLRPQRGAELPLEADITLQTLDDRFLGRLEGVKLRSLNQKNPDCYITRWSSFVVAGSVADHFDRHPLRPWLLQQQHLAELVFWPQLDHLTVEEACDQLLVRLRAKPSTLWLVLEGNGPSSSALDALMRSAAAELPLCRCTVLQVPRALEAQPKASDWSALQAAAEQHGLLRWCDGEIQIPHLEPLIPTRFRIATDGSGRIEGLRPVALPQRTLEPGEVELEVEATGLNFRDVLNSLGLLNHHLAEFGLSDPTQLPFGGECVGRVVGIGPGVDASLIGQQLIATLTVGSLASHVVAKVAFCTPLPNGMAVSDAAGVSTAFLTAIYGLEHLAQLQAGESVLIHAAAGGVGQAALQVALRRGARVFATASTAKQQALLEQGVEAVFDSRTLTFADQILQCTNGRGVDVVLNSFKGDWVDASFRALAQGGRFVELGKIDVWTHDQVRRLRPDAQYLPFDLLEVAERQPVLITQLLNQLIADFNKDFLKPLPTTVMSMECAQAAVRLMAQGKHVGKVVLTRPQPIHIRSDATYVVTGALGGIGRQLLPWLVERGARSLLLIGRSIDQLDSSAQSLLSQLHEAGATCLLLACDLGVGQKDLLIESFNALPADQPVRGIFHMAGVLADGPLDNLNSERLRTVVQPKLHGLLELEQACQRSASNALQFVVSFSSIAALFGSPGQVAYSAANGAMQGLCHEDATSIRRLAMF